MTKELEAANDDLVDRLARFAEKSGDYPAAIPGLTLFRCDSPTTPQAYIFPPGIAVVARGFKRAVLGDEEYYYGKQKYLIIGVDLPTLTEVLEASPETPYYSLMLCLDPYEIAQLLVEGIPDEFHGACSIKGMAVGDMTLPLLNALVRLLDLLETPEHIPTLAPLIKREIHYRLLLSPQGEKLRQIGTRGSKSNQIAKAVQWIKENYQASLKVSELAKNVNMSVSTFHSHFRQMTALSPLQFQKTLRLHEARRLMLTERIDAADAAFNVGYESPSQFSREYSRLFGAPPLRDVGKVMQA